MTPVSNLRFILGGLAAWPLLMAIATLDGMARELFMKQWIGTRPALLASGIIMLVAIYVVAWLMLSWWGRPHSTGCLWLLGALWVVLTIAFEYVMLVVVQARPSHEFVAGYDPMRIRDGNLIVPGLVLMLLAPIIVATAMRGLRRGRDRTTTTPR